ncbi:MAG: hypothetical protein J7518_04530 [Nocardioidaceae bacterium]|nr:hypothetical protein [Nocardioidaceae bacterium]
MRAFPRSVVVAGVAATACAALLAGCGADDEPSKPVAEDTPATSAPVTPAPTTPAPETSAPSTPDPATLSDRLLLTAQVPGLNAQWHWQDGRTAQLGTEPSNICAQASLVDIGATNGVFRTFFPPDDSDDNAAQQIAVFPDAKTTASAWSVLKSWQLRCGEAISADVKIRAGAPVAVRTSADEASWYLVTSQPMGEETGRFDAVGMIRKGTTISVLTMTNSGQDYSYPKGKEPMVAMVKAAAAKLG